MFEETVVKNLLTACLMLQLMVGTLTYPFSVVSTTMAVSNSG